MLNITKGKIRRAQKVVIYGPEGIGKSSLAARFPDPVIIDTEGGTAHMDIRRIDKPRSWEEMLAIVKEVANTPGICKTLVIDTADWAEQLITTYLCNKYKQNSIESFGYGKGYTYMAEEFARLLNACDQVIAAGMHVVVTAHAKMRKFEQPDEMGAYDRWEMKLSKQTAPLLKEWCDMLLFCNYQTFVVTSENDTKKAQGGKRVIYTSHHPAWDAKTRVELPDVIDLDYANIAFIFEPDEKPAPHDDDRPIDKFRQVMTESGISEEEVRKVVADKGHYPVDMSIDDYPDKFVTGWLIKYWPQIVELIDAGREKKNS
nr:MAG TPA: AAA domain protein [Caudoviricetes sp.]